jgi:hypothetical protein
LAGAANGVVAVVAGVVEVEADVVVVAPFTITTVL